MALKPKRKSQRAPPVDRLVKPGIVLILAMLAYHVMKGVQMTIPRIDPLLDRHILREVLLSDASSSSTNYVILCQDANDDVSISSVFLDAYSTNDIPNTEFMVLDCTESINDVVDTDDVTTKPKTVAEYLNLNIGTYPTIFLSSPRLNLPHQVPNKHLKTGNMLLKVMQKLLIPSAVKLVSKRTLRESCLEKDTCLVLLHSKGDSKLATSGNTKEMMRALAARYEDDTSIGITYIDSDVHYLKHVEDIVLNVPDYVPSVPRMVLFQRAVGSGTTTTRLKSTVIPYPYDADINSSSSVEDLVQFITDNNNNNMTTMTTKLPQLPVLQIRTKKSTEQIRTKREKYRTRTRNNSKNNNKADTKLANDDVTNDKAERKAERDRRRTEHHKAHNLKEKTPEQLQQQEQNRRERMEQEARQWDVLDDDVIDGYDDITDDGSVEEEWLDVVSPEDGDEAEDVLDLD